MTISSYFWLVTFIVVVRFLLRRFFRLEVLLGTFLYGCILFMRNIAMGLSRLFVGFVVGVRQSTRDYKPFERTLPQTILEVNSMLQLKSSEVMLGIGNNKPVRIDLEKYHTLVAGVTGSGKTICINNMIAQLVSKPGFLDTYDMYILDLKSSEKDYLHLWKPVCTGYYTIDQDGTTEQAITALNEIAVRMHNGDVSKRIIIFIDELAMLTQQAPDRVLRKRGDAALRRVAAQVRDRGCLILATQYPKHDVIDRAISSNTERKICFRVDDKRGAELVLRSRARSLDPTEMQDGQFILKEPSRRNKEVVGRTLMLNLPDDIQTIVDKVVEAKAESDDRLAVFKEACSRLQPGVKVPGINRVYKATGLTNKVVEAYYRNYVLAGAMSANFSEDGSRILSHSLNGNYQECLGRVVDYIKEGKWQAAPKPLTR